MQTRRALALVAISLPIRLAAQEKELTSLSLEEFLKVEVVSVRKSQQKLSRTPAAVFVITREDIRRSGATSLPEALRMAPGLHVAQLNGSIWAVGMRGFNNFSSNQLLVMIDGRTIYHPVMSGVIWNQQMIMLEDVERIEVIRGPAGAMWGANAVSGVINVITRKASATQGTLVSTATGTMHAAHASLRHGARQGETLAWRSWFHYERNSQHVRTRGVPPLDDWNTGRAGLRFDWSPSESDQVTVEGEVTALQNDVNVVRFPRPFAVEVAASPAGGTAGFLLAQWTHTYRSGDQSKLQLFEDLQGMSTGIVPFGLRTFDIDFQHSIGVSQRHSLLVGGGFRASQVSSAGNRDVWFEPAGRTYLISNIFLQDEWQLLKDRLVLTLGGKVERYTLASPAFQPSARLMWTPTRRQAYWAAVSGAVRVPSHHDYALRYPLWENGGNLLPIPIVITGAEQMRPERLRAVEAGFRWQLWRRAAAEFSGFQNYFNGLNAYQTSFPLTPAGFGAALRQRVTSIPATLVNGTNSVARGGEILLHYDVARNWRLLGSYSTTSRTRTLRPGFQRETTMEVGQYYPGHMAQIRSSWDLGRLWMIDAAVYRTGALKTNGRVKVAGFTRADLRLERKVSERAGIYVSGQNLLRPSQAEMEGDLVYPAARIGRNIMIGLRWEQ